MSIFSDLRTLVFLRRCAIALESLATSQRELTRLAVEADDRRVNEGFRAPPKQMQVGVLDPREASKRWRRQQVESGALTEEELDERYGTLT